MDRLLMIDQVSKQKRLAKDKFSHYLIKVIFERVVKLDGDDS